VARREAIHEQLVEQILAVRAEHPLRVGIDGVDGAGKTTLADELAKALGAKGRPCLRASIDGFHMPRSHRIRRGEYSPEGYFLDSFDYDALREELLDPLGPGGNRECRTRVFDYRTDSPAAEPQTTVPAHTVLLFDGVFLQRPELDGCWDFVVFVQAEFDTILRRVQDRDEWMGDLEEIRKRYLLRYIPGQQLYLGSCKPAARADVVVMNDLPESSALRLPFRSSEDTTEALLASQIEYYSARAPDYDEWFLRQGRYDRGEEATAIWFAEMDRAKDSLRRFGVSGNVLEIACGTGLWTGLLVPGADHLVVMDSSPEMLQACRERLGELPDIEYVQTDIFDWKPERRFDLVFFAYWLSHVPPGRFEDFWEIVEALLEPRGRVFFVDGLYNEASTAVDHVLEGPEATTVLRRLNDGREFRIVKVFHRPEELERRLALMGWDINVETAGSFVLFGHGGRHPPEA